MITLRQPTSAGLHHTEWNRRTLAERPIRLGIRWQMPSSGSRSADPECIVNACTEELSNPRDLDDHSTEVCEPTLSKRAESLEQTSQSHVIGRHQRLLTLWN